MKRNLKKNFKCPHVDTALKGVCDYCSLPVESWEKARNAGKIHYPGRGNKPKPKYKDPFEGGCFR